MPHNNLGRRADQQGFALPLVLVAIALMAILIASAFRMVEDASATAARLEENSSAEQALFSAEQLATYVFLTSQATANGYRWNVSGTDVADSDPSQEADSPGSPGIVWTGDGSIRRLDGVGMPMLIQYQDGAGIISLNNSTSESAAIFFEAMGVIARRSESLAAQLSDYLDENSVRRWQGAERADYRMRQRKAPPNAPLRSLEELASVLDAESILDADAWRNIRRFGTVHPTYAVLKPGYLDQRLTPVFDHLVELDHATFYYSPEDLLPSNRARLTFFALGAADLHVRIVDIGKTPAGDSFPFIRHLICERCSDAVIPQNFGEYSEYPALLVSETDRDDRRP